LLAELLTPDPDDQLGFREGRRHAARLVAAPSEELAAPIALSAEGSYLVTGGLEALGLLVARADGRSWTREVELAPPGTALVP